MTSKRQNAKMSGMSATKRATVYFDPDLHRALRLRAATSDRSISDMVNDAVKLALAEDAEDLAAFGERKREPSLDFEQFVKALKRRGRI
jgi:plasmid stability protein